MAVLRWIVGAANRVTARGRAATRLDEGSHFRPPVVLRAANRLGTGAAAVLGRRAVDLSEDSLLAAARRLTGLSDFGADPFLANLRALLASYESEGDLGLVGRVGTSRDLVRCLANRLQIEERFRRQPELTALAVRRPVFVVGLPRTGTTLLHRALAEDPAARAPRYFELMWPASAPAAPAAVDAPDAAVVARPDARRGRAATWLRYARWTMPAFQSIHPMAPDSPEECIFLLQNSFADFDATFRASLRSFADYLLRQDLTAEYRDHRRQMQLLQSERPAAPGAHWVLKAPSHLLALDSLLAVYPDAAVVWTHRDPYVALGSLCSMMAVLRSLFGARPVDLARVGQDALTWWGALVDRALEARARLDPARFLDVHYADLVADPVATVQRVGHHFGYAASPETDRAVRRWLVANPQRRHGEHHYRAEQFGLTREAVEARFAAYRHRFGPA